MSCGLRLGRARAEPPGAPYLFGGQSAPHVLPGKGVEGLLLRPTVQMGEQWGWGLPRAPQGLVWVWPAVLGEGRQMCVVCVSVCLGLGCPAPRMGVLLRAVLALKTH